MTEASRQRIIALLFAVYLVLLVWAVLWKLHVPFIGNDEMRGIKLVPFVRGGGFGQSAPREVLANLVLFVPFGVYLGALARGLAWWKAAAVVCAASLGLESAQFVLAAGSSDVTDVIVNTAGGIVGLAVVAVVRERVRSRILVPVLAVATLLALLGVAVVVGSFPRMPSPSDVMPGLSSAVEPSR